MSTGIDCVDFVVTHKPFPIAEIDMYKVLCVGDYKEPFRLTEKNGENIAQYNSRLNETTALYWIWKKTLNDYVGLSHYRRRFEMEGKILSKVQVRRIFDAGYDLIISRPKELNWSVMWNIGLTVGLDLNHRAHKVIRELLQERQPEYVTAFDDTLYGNWMYTCNMFVARRDILNEYCEWLFSFIIDAADRIDVTGADFYQRRVAGYYAEIMWTVWLREHSLKVCRLPIVMQEVS